MSAEPLKALFSIEMPPGYWALDRRPGNQEDPAPTMAGGNTSAGASRRHGRGGFGLKSSSAGELRSYLSMLSEDT
jgi:hypothetical protein